VVRDAGSCQGSPFRCKPGADGLKRSTDFKRSSFRARQQGRKALGVKCKQTWQNRHVASAETERSVSDDLPPLFAAGRERSKVRGGPEVPADGGPGAGDAADGAGDPRQKQDPGAEAQPGRGRAAARSDLLVFGSNVQLFD